MLFEDQVNIKLLLLLLLVVVVVVVLCVLLLFVAAYWEGELNYTEGWI